MSTTLKGIRDKDIVTRRATIAVGKTMTTLAYAGSRGLSERSCRMTAVLALYQARRDIAIAIAEAEKHDPDLCLLAVDHLAAQG
jgi:hypothetical protein